jgi:hypothetical protein
VLDSNDFNSITRSGNEKDVFYRVSLFEKPAKSLSSRMMHLNHGLGIGAAVGVAGWQEQIVGLCVMQRHGVSSKAYMGRNVGPLLYLTKLDVKCHHR